MLLTPTWVLEVTTRAFFTHNSNSCRAFRCNSKLITSNNGSICLSRPKIWWNLFQVEKTKNSWQRLCCLQLQEKSLNSYWLLKGIWCLRERKTAKIMELQLFLRLTICMSVNLWIHPANLRNLLFLRVQRINSRKNHPGHRSPHLKRVGPQWELLIILQYSLFLLHQMWRKKF